MSAAVSVSPSFDQRVCPHCGSAIHPEVKAAEVERERRARGELVAVADRAVAELEAKNVELAQLRASLYARDAELASVRRDLRGAQGLFRDVEKLIPQLRRTLDC